MNSNKTISILGCGWLGFELAKNLMSLGFQVKGSTTSASKLSTLENEGIVPFLINLNEPLDQIDSLFFQSDVLVLNIPPGRRNPDLLGQYPSRIEKALRLALKESISNCILVSSTGVFQSLKVPTSNLDFPVYTQQAPNGKSASANAMIKGEQFIKEYFSDTGTILRFGGLVGGDRLAGRFLSGRKDVKNGLAPVNMIHRDDCIKIIAQIINKEKWGFEYNAVSDLHPTRSEFYTAQARKHNFAPPTFINTDRTEGKIMNNQWLKTSLKYDFIYPDPMSF